MTNFLILVLFRAKKLQPISKFSKLPHKPFSELLISLLTFLLTLRNVYLFWNPSIWHNGLAKMPYVKPNSSYLPCFRYKHWNSSAPYFFLAVWNCSFIFWLWSIPAPLYSIITLTSNFLFEYFILSKHSSSFMCNDFQTTSSNCHDFWILILQNVPILSVDKKNPSIFCWEFSDH